MATSRCAVLLVSVLGLACGSAAPSTTSPDSYSASPTAPTTVFEPSPFLDLLRLERVAAKGSQAGQLSDRSPDDNRAEKEPGEASGESSDTEFDSLVKGGVLASGDDEDGDDESTDGERRTVIVRSSRFADPEDIFRYDLRSMDKKPRLFNPTRALARQGGLVRVFDDGGAGRPLMRRYVRQVIRERQPSIKACIAAELAQDPRVIIKEPSGVVFEQALRLGDGIYRFSLDIVLEDDQLRVEATASPDTPVGASAGECLGDAFADTSISSPATEGGRADAQAPLTVFVQMAEGVDGPPLGAGLALQAATMGWIHYERGEFLEAREFFLDAAWAYRLPEYQMLVGRAEEQLGRPQHAMAAYQLYVEERPDAPDTPALSRKIAALRGALKQ